MKFTKMHGAGNDYVYINCLQEKTPADPAGLARRISDRHTGVGSDGLILIHPAQTADARMQMFNADGSEAEMCGNGLRCLAKFVYEHGVSRKNPLRIETAGGLVTVNLQIVAGRVQQAEVNMGRPVLESRSIPTTLPGNPPQEVDLDVAGRCLQVTCVSMGNPHCVLFNQQLGEECVASLGPQIEHHAAFPRRTNVEFVEVVSPEECVVNVWERGAGVTQACGTGACAAVVAGVLTGRAEPSVVCHLPGGDLRVRWLETGEVTLAGPAEEVFHGQWPDV